MQRSRRDEDGTQKYQGTARQRLIKQAHERNSEGEKPILHLDERIPRIPLTFGHHTIRVWAGEPDRAPIDHQYYRSLIVSVDGQVSGRARFHAAQYGVKCRGRTPKQWLSAILKVHPYAVATTVNITHDETPDMLRYDLWEAMRQQCSRYCLDTAQFYHYAAICRELWIAKYTTQPVNCLYDPELIAELCKISEDPVGDMKEFLRAFAFVAGSQSAKELRQQLKSLGVRFGHAHNSRDPWLALKRSRMSGIWIA